MSFNGFPSEIQGGPLGPLVTGDILGPMGWPIGFKAISWRFLGVFMGDTRGDGASSVVFVGFVRPSTYKCIVYLRVIRQLVVRLIYTNFSAIELGHHPVGVFNDADFRDTMVRMAHPRDQLIEWYFLIIFWQSNSLPWKIVKNIC